jgi:membrane associated rhomboid family serine protease
MYDIWSVDVPMERWPIANWLLIAFIVIVTFTAFGLQEKPDTHRYHQLIVQVTSGKLQGADLVKKVDELNREAEKIKEKSIPGTLHPQNFRFHQLATNIVVHANLWHLVGNMIFLFIFGNAINSKLGHGWYLLCFFAIGIFESVLWLIIGDGRSTLGASAAIMGILGLFLVFYPRNNIKMVWWFYGIPVDEYFISAFWIILLYLGFDLVGAIWFGRAGIGFLSHLCGAALGIVTGIVMLKTGWMEPVYEEENILQSLGFEERLKRHPY